MTGFESKWNYKIQITKRKKICFCLWISLTLPKTFPTLFLSSLDLFIGQARSQTCSGRALQMEKVGGKLGKTASNRGETDSPEPVTGVTGCDGLHVTGSDGLWCWWRLGRVEGWRPSPWSLTITDLFLSSFSRRISPFLRMEASITVYLKHNQTTSIT